ncbi:unnamed protein product, partial [marine sediment metagenome]
LPEKVIAFILRNLSKKIMRKDGTLMFSNIANDNPFRPWIDLIGNWALIERNEKEMRKLLAITGCKEQKLTKESTGLTWIATAS